MKATLKKHLNVSCYDTFLTIEKSEERGDIKNFLNDFDNGKKTFKDVTIQKRVEDYLKKEGLINETGLTEQGREVLNTGKMLFREKGKYRIWLVEKDNFLKNRILHFERQKIVEKNNSESEHITPKIIDIFSMDHELLPIDSRETEKIKVIKNDDNKIDASQKQNEKILLIWEWDEMEKSDYYFEGAVNNRKIEQNLFKSDENLEKWFSSIYPEWNKKEKRLKTELPQKVEEIKNFQKDTAEYNKKDFDSLEFKSVPLMPKDLNTAEEWRNALLKKDLKNEYINETDFSTLSNKLIKNEAFNVYRENIKPPVVSDFLEKLQSSNEKSKQTSEFWHLSAPFDLNPEKDEKSTLKSINFNPGDTTSFYEIASKIKGRGKKYTHIFYCDWFTHREDQQKKIVSYLDAFDISQKHLITFTETKKDEVRSDYIKKRLDISEHNIRDISKEKKNHDRYIVLVNENKEILVWKQTQSIDFISFDVEDFDSETPGKTEDISFSKHEEQMLKPDLIAFIKKEAKIGD
ncbi:MAG TPA: hypothetical protein PLW37_04745 [bacterium]|nr:hypothetical protein [bacterium]